jgi:prophage regulatory protein
LGAKDNNINHLKLRKAIMPPTPVIASSGVSQITLDLIAEIKSIFSDHERRIKQLEIKLIPPIPVVPSEIGFLRLPQVLAIFPVSRSAFWAGVKSGKYPKPVKISERCTAWRAEDIRDLISSYDIE